MTADASVHSADQPTDGESLLELYLTDATLQGLAERTLATYESDLLYFLEWLDADPRGIGRRDLQAFLYHLKNERRARDGSAPPDSERKSVA